MIDIRENVTLSGTTIEDGVIKGIKLLGNESKNGNSYPLETRRKATRVLEGSLVNLNHPDKKNTNSDTPVQNRLGKLVNVEARADGTYADLQFLTKHPFAPALVEAASRMPEMYGFSINGKGTVKKSGGKTIVESIDTIRSVDLVADPATVKSLFESENMEPEETATPEDHYWEACKQAVLSILEGEGDVKEKVKKIKEHLTQYDKMFGQKEEETPTEQPAEEPKMEESWKAEYKTLKTEKDCRVLLESNNIPVETVLVETLSLMDTAAREKFVTWHRKKGIVKAPRASEALRESVLPETDFVQLLRKK